MSAVTVYVTTGTQEEARDIARTIINEGLVACVNILGNISSIYRWDGEIKEDIETALLIKTRRELTTKLTDRIKELHSYDCPCVTVMNIANGNPDYIAWIEKETS